MPVFYVRSTDGDNADNGSTWALAKATLAGAFAAAAAGDTIWVSQAHAETQGSAMTLTSPGTVANPCYVMCGNDAAARGRAGDIRDDVQARNARRVMWQRY